jgi:hypothetical protein
MLGVNRTTVTVIAGKLQQAGMISCRHGRPAQVEETACECYRTIYRRTDAVFRPVQERDVLAERSS